MLWGQNFKGVKNISFLLHSYLQVFLKIILGEGRFYDKTPTPYLHCLHLSFGKTSIKAFLLILSVMMVAKLV